MLGFTVTPIIYTNVSGVGRPASLSSSSIYNGLLGPILENRQEGDVIGVLLSNIYFYEAGLAALEILPPGDAATGLSNLVSVVSVLCFVWLVVSSKEE